jgi:hypothetical protein
MEPVVAIGRNQLPPVAATLHAKEVLQNDETSIPSVERWASSLRCVAIVMAAPPVTECDCMRGAWARAG